MFKEEPKHTRYLRLFVQDLNEIIMMIEDEKQKLDTMKLSAGPKDYNYVHALEGALSMVGRKLEVLKREYSDKLPKPIRILSGYIEENSGVNLLD